MSDMEDVRNANNTTMDVQGTIFDIKRYAIHDGPGIRVTVFMKGCPLHCLWCHNPEGLNPEPERIVHNSDNPDRQREEIVGRKISVPELMKEILKDELFMDESSGGVTFSGGEPLMQIDFLIEALKACKEAGLHKVLDTSGHCEPDEFLKVVPYVDEFLYDLKLIDNDLHEKYTGAKNTCILKNLATLTDLGKDVVIRFPVIKGITDTDENIGAFIELLSTMKGINNINLLPYHDIAVGKYRGLGREYDCADATVPRADRMNYIKERLISAGFEVKVG